MNLAELIATDPVIEAQALAGAFQPVYAWLHDPAAESRLVERLITDRTVLAETINPATGCLDSEWANGILDKLDGIAAQSSLVSRAMRRLYGDGLDIGHPATQAQIGALVGPGMLTQDEADALKALGVRPCSRAQKHGLSATLADLWEAYK